MTSEALRHECEQLLKALLPHQLDTFAWYDEPAALSVVAAFAARMQAKALRSLTADQAYELYIRARAEEIAR